MYTAGTSEAEAGDPQGQAEDHQGRPRQLENLRTQKSTLLARLANIEAKLKMIEATQAKNEFNFDGSACPAPSRPSPSWKNGSTSWPARPRSKAAMAIWTAPRPMSIRHATWSRKSMRQFGHARPRPRRRQEPLRVTEPW